ncbi:MAG: Cys-tRNA(Pro) deacylase [SAR324 cluster bacterium]|nr:Cys-tRNA(Pro) deacylase [SAR324 cluster bacterium]
MTPAIRAVKKAKVSFSIHDYQYDPNAEAYGPAAAKAIGVDEQQVFKTLIAEINGKQLAVGIVPVSKKLDLKAFAAAMKVKKASMAKGPDAERVTGYVVGGISPLGQKKRLPMILDESAQQFETIYVSAGKRGMQIEITADSLIGLTQAKVACIAH